MRQFNKDKHILFLFKRRDSLETKVILKSGVIISVWNIAWNYDIGDEFAHITTNISPTIDNATIDFFYSNEIEKIFDAKSDELLLSSLNDFN